MRRPRPIAHPAAVAVLGLPVIVLGAAGAAVAVRAAPVDPSRWHRDPLTATPPSSPTWYRVTPADTPVRRASAREGIAPTVPVPVTDLARALDRVATGEDRVQVLAGSAAEGLVTYVQRSALMGFPDLVSVRFVDLGEGRSSLAVFSRARYGRSDLGVNEQRVNRWVADTLEAVRA